MTSCLEKCDEIARSKPARIFYGILLIIICTIGIMRLLNASNQLQNERELKTSKLELLVRPEEGLIHFKGTLEDSQTWTAKLNEFFAPYSSQHPNRQKCDYDKLPAPGKVCEFDLNQLGLCLPKISYESTPSAACIFLKLRVDPSWTPQFLNASNLPAEVPKDLRDYIYRSDFNKNQKIVWMSCKGETPVDEENIGPITYVPERGFRNYYINSEAPEPLIAIDFVNPTKGVVISVECKIWAKNADDSVTFQVMFD